MTAELEGQELRERVAHIMGWVYRDAPGNPLSTGWYAPDQDMKTISSVLPEFEADPAACKLVKDWLRERGVEYDIQHRIKEGGAPLVWVTRGSKFNDVIVAPTEELAVCRFVVALAEGGN